MSTFALNLAPSPAVLGPLHNGVYVQVGMGLGFYVPQASFDACKRAANETRRVQFLTVDAAGAPIAGTRAECLSKGSGCIAWILPDEQGDLK